MPSSDEILKKYDGQEYTGKWEIVAVYICNGCCDECKKLDGLQLSIPEAIQKKLLPYQYCTNDYGCNCTLAVIAKRDASGRLILKPKDS